VERARGGALLLAGWWSLGVLTFACGENNSTSHRRQDAQQELTDAADRTLGLDSFQIDVETLTEDISGEYTVSYQAPDRARTVNSDGTTTIYDGPRIYLSTPEDNDTYMLITTDEEALPLEQLLEPLRVVRNADQVRRQGDRHIMDLDDADGTIEAEVDDGFISYIRIQWKNEHGAFTFVYRLSEFDAVAAIKLPPADRIVESPPIPDCPPDRPLAEPVLCVPARDNRAV
jgi:hypothetical protein